MSRSRKKSPFIGVTTARSDKPFKVDEHRRERRSVRTLLASGFPDYDRRFHSKVYGDPWRAPKDGRYMVEPASKWMRK